MDNDTAPTRADQGNGEAAGDGQDSAAGNNGGAENNQVDSAVGHEASNVATDQELTITITENPQVFNGLITIENGLRPTLRAKISIDYNTGSITVSFFEPADIIVGPGYPIVLHGDYTLEGENN